MKCSRNHVRFIQYNSEWLETEFSLSEKIKNIILQVSTIKPIYCVFCKIEKGKN